MTSATWADVWGATLPNPGASAAADAHFCCLFLQSNNVTKSWFTWAYNYVADVPVGTCIMHEKWNLFFFVHFRNAQPNDNTHSITVFCMNLYKRTRRVRLKFDVDVGNGSAYVLTPHGIHGLRSKWDLRHVLQCICIYPDPPMPMVHSRMTIIYIIIMCVLAPVNYTLFLLFSDILNWMASNLWWTIARCRHWNRCMLTSDNH